jgi:hypothetical protein
VKFQTAASRICLLVLCVLAACAFCARTSWAAPARKLVSPLPASDYSLRPACGTPAPGHAACLAVQLVPQTSEAKAHRRPLGMARSIPLTRSASTLCSPPSAAEGCYGLRPQDLHSAYDLPTSARAEQTIALVDAYDDPTVEADLRVYDEELKLPACTNANGCFTKVNQNGAASPLPSKEGEWAVEISLDVEIAHAICQSCRIVLVEAQSSTGSNLERAERTVEAMGANEISNSWSGEEPASDSATFDDSGVVITAASGDDGYLNWADPALGSSAGYPASSPNVVAVGGTRLSLTGEGAWAGETVWNGASSSKGKSGGAAGGGCSTHFAAPAWQQALANWSAVGCGSYRAVADVSADADPYTGVAVYDSTALSNGTVPGWFTVGGTSLASPLIAATFALAGGAGGVEHPAQTLYASMLAEPALLHDVTSGSNGACSRPALGDGLSGCTPAEAAESCSQHAICLAGEGYDGPTGLGTPAGIGAFIPGPRESQQVEFKSNPPQSARVGGPTYAVSATASSGLAVALSAVTPTICKLTGSAVSFLAAGTCTIKATQGGDLKYEPAEAQQSFAVAKGTQRIEFTAFPDGSTVGATEAKVSALATSGLPVAVQALTPSVCSVSEAGMVSLLGLGTCTIEAQQSGNANWEEAPPLEQSFTVEKGQQRISFTSHPEEPVVGGPFYTVSASANSGLTIAFLSLTPSVCAIAGAEVSFVAVGTCTIEAQQPGGADWEAAPSASQSFVVHKRAQVVEYTSHPPASAVVGDPAYEVSAVDGSHLPISVVSMTPLVCTVSGMQVSFIAPGTCTIAALQWGDAEYAEALPAEQSFDVASAAQSLLTGPAFALLGAPRVNHKTGAITFRASVEDLGSFSWRLTFRERVAAAHRGGAAVCDRDGCWRWREIVFAQGSMTTAAGTIRIVIKPNRAAASALAARARSGRPLRVQALLSFQSSLGAGLFSRTRTVTVRLARIGPRT